MASTSSEKKSPQEIIQGFQRLREEQRSIVLRMHELEGERSEHSLVIDTLAKTDGERRCFRMVGGVLVERKVKEILPAVRHNHEQLGKVIESLKKQLETKGAELNNYRENHGIKIRGDADEKEDKKGAESSKSEATSAGVLVADS